MKKTFLALIIFSGLFIFSQGTIAVDSAGLVAKPGWQGIVPCARWLTSSAAGEKEDKMCTLCDLIVGIQRIFNYGLFIILSIAFLGIFLAGVLYIISSGDEGLMTKAKTFLRSALIGFALVACAWLIVNVVLWLIVKKDASDPDLTTRMGIGQPNWYTFNCNHEGKEMKSFDGSTGDGGSATVSPTETPSEQKYSCDPDGKCQPKSNGTYTSKAECEKPTNCRKDCAQKGEQCKEGTRPCCAGAGACSTDGSASGAPFCGLGTSNAPCGDSNAGRCKDNCGWADKRAPGTDNCTGTLKCCAVDPTPTPTPKTYSCNATTKVCSPDAKGTYLDEGSCLSSEICKDVSCTRPSYEGTGICLPKNVYNPLDQPCLNYRLGGGDTCKSGFVCCFNTSAGGAPCGKDNAGICIFGKCSDAGKESVSGGNDCSKGSYCCTP